MSDSEEYTSGTYGIEMLSQALEAGCHESEECLGCQCCVCWTGQIHCKIANEYQRKEKKKLKRYPITRSAQRSSKRIDDYDRRGIDMS